MNIFNDPCLKGVEIFYYPKTGTKIALLKLTPSFAHCTISKYGKTYTGCCRGSKPDGRLMSLCVTLNKLGTDYKFRYGSSGSTEDILKTLGDFIRII